MSAVRLRAANAIQKQKVLRVTRSMHHTQLDNLLMHTPIIAAMLGAFRGLELLKINDNENHGTVRLLLHGLVEALSLLVVILAAFVHENQIDTAQSRRRRPGVGLMLGVLPRSLVFQYPVDGVNLHVLDALNFREHRFASVITPMQQLDIRRIRGCQSPSH